MLFDHRLHVLTPLPCARLLGRGVIAAAAVALAASVNACSSNGGANVGLVRAAFDVHGASNSPCTLTVSNGSASFTIDVAPPAPPVENTTLAPRAPVSATCSIDTSPDAGTGAAVTSSVTGAFQAWRGTTCLAVSAYSFPLETIGYNDQSANSCPVDLTLTCGGVTLYDHVRWTACAFAG